MTFNPATEDFSMLSSLIAKEDYLEPSTTGELLPDGRKPYKEWVKERKKEMEQQNEIQIASSSTDMVINKLKGSSKAVLIDSLMTLDIFPSKYMVDSHDEENNAESTPPTTKAAASVYRDNKKSRKSALFQSDCYSCNKTPSSHDDVHENASLYSMMRAWIQDNADPEQGSCPPSAVAAARGGVRRKTLSDYKNDEQRSSSSSRGDKDQQQQQQQQQPSLRREQRQDPKPEDPSLQQQPPQSVDVLGWLSTHPDFRSHTPCYPTTEEMRELRHKRRAQKASRALRKKRIAAAKKSLWRKGIFL